MYIIWIFNCIHMSYGNYINAQMNFTPLEIRTSKANVQWKYPSTFFCIILLQNQNRDNINLLTADILQSWLSPLTSLDFCFHPKITPCLSLTLWWFFNCRDRACQPGNPATNSTKDFTVNKTMNETSFWHTEQLSAVFCRLFFFFSPKWKSNFKNKVLSF